MHPSADPRPVRVLQSFAEQVLAPNAFTSLLVTTLPDDVAPSYFTWRRALRGRYDVFHVHWPESLLRHGRWPGRVVKGVLFTLLLAVLTVRRTVVVRTLHNLTPHEPGGRLEAIALARLDRLTRVWIRLTPSTPEPPSGVTVTIPAGHYRDLSAPSAPSTERRPRPGRLVFFGLIRPYKNVEGLLGAFRSLEDPALELRVLGRPDTPATAASVRRARGEDDRVDLRLEYVDDAALARELGEAELVVLPYSEMHNSGALLHALSAGRPVLVPRTEANVGVAEEVGPGWVHLYDGDLTSDDLAAALARVRQGPPPADPDLTGRDWTVLGRRLAEVYRHAQR
jgi:beta-1,4-mannosyltransferase